VYDNFSTAKFIFYVTVNLCLSLVSGVPPLLFRTTPLHMSYTPWSVSMSVSVLGTTVSPAETVEQIGMTLGGQTRADPRDYY